MSALARSLPMQLKKGRVFVFVICLIFVLLVAQKIFSVSKLEDAHARLVLQVAQLQQEKSLRRHLSAANEQDRDLFNEDDQIIIYNRVPKTGSTSFAGIAYELCYKNKYHVLHVNTTKNAHTLSIQDQVRFIQNITEWTEKRPALYHGHFFYIDFDKLGYNQRRPLYINIIRRPLDRLLSYYYFVRFGDNFRPMLRRSKWQNAMTFDDCVQQNHPDCDPENLWLQVPFFCGHAFKCRQPGSRWALEQAKHNLLNNYLLVGITEELGDFIAMVDVILPRFFRGAMDLYLNGERSHLRKTAKKEQPKEETIAKIQESSIWKMENEFYEFAVDQFHFLKRMTFTPVDQLDTEKSGTDLENIENRPTYQLSDGRLYVERGNNFHYEKIRPR